VRGRWERWGPISGLLLCITWAPMLYAIPKLPDLGSAQRVEAFWRDNQELMQGVILSVSVGFIFLLGFLGALVERLRSGLADHALIWVAFGSVLMFMTALNVALGLDIAGGLLVETDPASTYALHTAGFLLAAPAAFASTAFFVAIAGITWDTRIFHRRRRRTYRHRNGRRHRVATPRAMPPRRRASRLSTVLAAWGPGGRHGWPSSVPSRMSAPFSGLCR
jgi:hypothetical protein